MAFELPARECGTALRTSRTTSHTPHMTRVPPRRPPATTPPPCKSKQRTSTGPLLSAEEAPAPTAGHRRSAPAVNLRGLTRKSCTCKGRPPSYEAPHCGTAKRRPEHGTKPDFDIRLIPPYANDHSSCMAQAPSWISRIAAYGPGPSVWSPGSLAHPHASHSAPAVADDRRLQPTGAVRRGS